ncbi:MAG: ferrous iron transport protein B [Bacteroidetes bacterium]|nr:ferrous iron transport protein B [Bacteroidota bacterium]
MKRIALIGNPNSGKSSLFNALTGLNQKTGNYPGVTVDRNAGHIILDDNKVEVIDLPGTYSLYPNSRDELVVSEELLTHHGNKGLDAVVYVADITLLDKELLLLTQVMDLEYPVVLALNMADLQSESSIEKVEKKIREEFGIEVVSLSAKRKTNIDELKRAISVSLHSEGKGSAFMGVNRNLRLIKALQGDFPDLNDYGCLLVAHHHKHYAFLTQSIKSKVEKVLKSFDFDSITEQIDETMERYNKMGPVLRVVNLNVSEAHTKQSKRLDKWLVHPFFGPVIFLAMMLLVFQAVFSWSQYPMAGIEWIFFHMGDVVTNYVKIPWLADLLTNGVLAGLGAILVFTPQIAILFFLLAILEQSGYMARVVFMFDPLMRKVGLSGRSMVALFSGAACAVPAIMSARTIRNPKERLNTILVTPLISCSARLPVYILLIGMLVPAGSYAGIISKQAAVFVLIYLISIVSTFLMAWIFKMVLRTEGGGMLLLDLPVYQRPVIRDVIVSVWSKVKTFAWQAGRIIFVLSLVIWVASSYGPSGEMAMAKAEAAELAKVQGIDAEEASRLEGSMKLEHSYAGHLGKFIEPAIRPLGFDWKIGIGLISAFAAREVFVGTLATIYSVGDDSNQSLQEKMQSEVFRDSGEKVFSFATIISLILFFIFAMQCMSTVAIVKKETNSWKWPMFQMVYMTAIAIILSFTAYQILS